MTNSINSQNAGLFSAAAYAPINSTSDPDTSKVIALGWHEIVINNEENSQTANNGSTQFRIFVNPDTQQIVMAFKGSNSVPDFQSDILDSGFAQYDALHDKAADALTELKSNYSGYSIIADGHSLGGGMAQSFALEFNLDGYGQNALPVSTQTIGKYFAGQNIADVVSIYKSDHSFTEVNVSGDIATLKYSTIEHQLYIATQTITLASPYVAMEVIGAATATVSGGYGLGLFAYAGGKAHLLSTLNPLAMNQIGPGVAEAPAGSAANVLNNISEINSNDHGNSFTVKTTDGKELQINQSLNANGKAEISISGYNDNGKIGMMSTFDLTTGRLLGQATVTDEQSPSNTEVIDSDIASISHHMDLLLQPDIVFALELGKLRDFSGTQNTNEAWAGNQLLNKFGYKPVDPTSSTYSGSNEAYSSYSYSGIDLSKVFADKSSAGQFFVIGDNNHGTSSISATYIAPNNLAFGFSADNDGFSLSFGFLFPIVLDLDGDGVELISRDTSSAYFDMTGSGYRNHTGWVGADDGLLVLDIDHDGVIDQAKEVSFALWTDNPDDSDLDGLKATFDNNHDGVIDVDDDSFVGLRIWQDINGNGVSEAGELKSLNEWGITSISLNSVSTNWSSGGNQVGGFTTYDKVILDTNGNPVITQGFAADVGFGYEENSWKTSVTNGLITTTESGGLTLASTTTAQLKLNISNGSFDGAVGTSGNDSLTSSGSDVVVLEGGNGNDTLKGGSGDDWLNGGNGIDELSGGSGDDTLIIDASDNLLKLDGGKGFDTVLVTGTTGVTLNLTKAHIEVAIGSEGNDIFSATSSETKQTVALFGQDGNDSLNGGWLRDILEGGKGNDTLTGNYGNDAYIFSRGDSVDTIIERVASATAKADKDTLILGDNISLADVVIAHSGNDLLVGIKPVDTDIPASVNTDQQMIDYILSLDDHIIIQNWEQTKFKVEYIGFADGGVYGLDYWITGTTGIDSGANTLVGTSKADVLSGGPEGDAMRGGKGNDAYVVDDQDDVVIELNNQGTDTVFSTITYSLSNFVENMQLVGTNTIDATGNSLDNKLTGNSANNKLSGGEGNDTLDGGIGVDTLIGGQGDDTFKVDHVNDVISELSNQGKDTVLSSITTYTLSAEIENLTLIAEALVGNGNASNNVITGNNYNNILDGGAGHDTLIGGLGNDTYYIDSLTDKITEKKAEGTDTVISSLNYTLGKELENLTLSEVAGANTLVATIASGNELNNVISGNSLDNKLNGLAGNDTLNGGIGKDTMAGGAGDDIYVVDNINDVVTEVSGQGTDSVISNLTFYTLGNFVENLTLGGTNTSNGTGNSLNNTIVGNSADNVLDGGAGNDILSGKTGRDTMIGGAGNDTYLVGSLGDVVTETDAVLKTGGADIVYSDINYSLGDNVENLVLTNTVNISGLLATDATGNSLINMIYGNNADNLIDGMGGNDSMYGGYGDDIYLLDNANDKIYESANQGIDTVITTVSLSALASNVENLTLLGVATTAVGNSLNNLLLGNELSNKLSGSSGNDTLIGGLGNDSLYGGTGNDYYLVNSSSDLVGDSSVSGGNDTVDANFSYTLGSYLENLILNEEIGSNGQRALTGTGNTLHNTIIGNSANNTLTGLDGNDTLDGRAGADQMIGGNGNDTYVIDNISDTIIEVSTKTTEIDTVLSSIDHSLGSNLENLTLTGIATINGMGNALNNNLIGNMSRNQLKGDIGNDTLDGGIGIDTLSGGAGNDTYIVDSVSDVVLETNTAGNDAGGVDLVQSTAATYILSEHIENLTLLGTAAIDGTGNALNNKITGNAAANKLDGGAGNDTLIGGRGDDTYYVDSLSDTVTEAASQGIDTIITGINNYVIASNVENLTLLGSAVIGKGNTLNNLIQGNIQSNNLDGSSGNDTLLGDAGNDTLLGGAGNDFIDGGTGIDSMTGGTGDDYYTVDSSQDVIVEAANGGTDTVESSVTYTLSDAIESLILVGNAAINGTGNASANIIQGNLQANYLLGNDGNDTLIGGGGKDTLSGGLGNDFYSIDSTDDVIIETIATVSTGGVDTVESSVTYTLTDNVENLILLGEDEIDGTGNALANQITGNIADNMLSGGAGKDTMIGGLGDDIYIVDSTDVITEYLDEGFDIVFSSVEYTLLANIENLSLASGIGDMDGTGNTSDNEITGNNYKNYLNGSSGNDTLYGEGGADSLYGSSGDDYLDGGEAGDGIDTLRGGSGNDYYIINEAPDILTEKNGDGTNAGGLDTVESSVTYTLQAYFEDLILSGTDDIDGTGNSSDNRILGNSGINTMAGLAGDDTYGVDNEEDVVLENASAGTDTVISTITYTLGENVENLVLSSNLNLNGTGNSSNNAITGNDAGNNLKGLIGNDTLDGGVGIDTLEGGAGNDVYVVDNELDVVIEAFNEGIDTIQSKAETYTLSTNVENLTLIETGDSEGIGNDLNNIITGNVGSNRLDGGIGKDTMIGGLGDDVYIVDNSLDDIRETANQGIDTVIASVNFTVASDDIENLTLIGTAINGTGNSLANLIIGNELNNFLTGNNGNDTLDGSEGADTMQGGFGNDVYIVDHANDLVTENLQTNEGVSYGNDTVQSTISLTLFANIENLTLIGEDEINGTGNTLSNIIIGNIANNLLTGGNGHDTLDGGGGDDTLIGGIHNDTYIIDSDTDVIVENVGEGTDTVQSTISYTLSGTNLEYLTLLGEAAIYATGNTSNNKLTGNAADNIFDGGGGVDTMAGGAGDDIYYVDSTTDSIQESLEEGIDTIYSTVTLTLAANVENLNLLETGAINGSGNALNNYITGNSQINKLYGNDGNDTLDGGAGADSLTGGNGDDTYIIDNIADVISETSTGGSDTVVTNISYTLGLYLENLTLSGNSLISGTGNTLNNLVNGNDANNTLYGLVGNDTLDGGVGNDTLYGGAGDDTYIVDSQNDVVQELVGEGTDTIQTYTSLILTANIENLTLLGDTEIDGEGNELNNILTGNSAANQLDGGLGRDTLAGGQGNDTYIIDVDNDVIMENTGEGTDTALSMSNYTLSSNVENLTLLGDLGIENLNGIGNEMDNFILGNNGNNTLTGLDGNDTLDGINGTDMLIGGVGDDTYLVSNNTTTITENSGEGNDAVITSQTYTLGINLENLSLGLNNNLNVIDGTGNALNNTLIGNDAANLLNGLGGNNTLTGGLDDDVFILSTSGSVDTITDFTIGDDHIWLENEIFTSFLSSGNLQLSSFKSGLGLTSGQDADDYLIYDSTTGNLYYDALGNTAGSAAAIQIAQLSAGLALTSSDFLVI
ncbi:hypothetical protein A7981_00960 [Methylovorus sp. MM2]|uniref:lipase family protein n=1 Tax=Methylovorus sp. MM2 TaxID=1848038 RepID=UPI0007E1853D|nr:hypothetical protein [Methylovorus sp. MM2]OAM52090.1 hypothetical protein A7981_00960 [Methylovorus sp. MM2]